MRKFEENDIRVIKLILNYVMYGMLMHYIYELLDSLVFILQKVYT